MLQRSSSKPSANAPVVKGPLKRDELDDNKLLAKREQQYNQTRAAIFSQDHTSAAAPKLKAGRARPGEAPSVLQGIQLERGRGKRGVSGRSNYDPDFDRSDASYLVDTREPEAELDREPEQAEPEQPKTYEEEFPSLGASTNSRK